MTARNSKTFDVWLVKRDLKSIINDTGQYTWYLDFAARVIALFICVNN